MMLAQGKMPGKDGKPFQIGLGGPAKGGKGAGLMPMPRWEEKKNLQIEKKTPNAKVAGKRSDPRNPGLTLMFKGEPERNGRSTTPYYQVYAQQNRAAESAVNKENIPAPYRQQVKAYFEGIKP